MQKNKEINFAYIHNIRIPSENAHGVYVMKTCEAAARLNVKTHLIISARGRSDSASIWKHYGIDPSSFEIIRTTTRGVLSPFLNIFSKINHPLATIWFGMQAVIIASKRKIDVIQTCDPEVLVILFLVQKIYRPIIIYDIHIDQPQWLRGWLLDHVNLVITNCIYYDQEMNKRGMEERRRISLPNGYDKQLFAENVDVSQLRRELGISKTDFVIGYIGKFETLGEEKGIRTLIQAAAKLKNKVPFKIVLVGGPESLLKEYQQMVNDLEINQQAVLLPLIPPHQVPQYMKLCNLGWLVYPDTPRFRDRISPMKALEYAASKMPIIASDIPSIRGIFSDNEVFFVDPNDPEMIAKQIEYIYQNQNLAHQKMMSALSVIQHFDWTNRQQMILDKGML